MLLFQSAVLTTLQADAALMAMVPGGVWNRELKPDGAGHTTAAWGPLDPDDPLSPTGLRPSIVVRDAGEFDSGFRFGASAKAMVFAYVPASDAGRTLLAAIDARIRVLFDRQPMTVASGDGVARHGESRLTARSVVLDEPIYGGVMFTSWVLTLTTARLSLAG